MKRGAQQMKQNQIRMTEEFKNRIHKYQKKVQQDTGAVIDFSEAARALIDRGLKEAKL
jgi:hypothetical protein